MKSIIAVAILSLAICHPSTALADMFGSGSNLFEIEFVDIGNPNNPADNSGDPNPAGSVPYEYRIGKYEISEDMIDKANSQSSLDGNPLGITKDTRDANKPATSVTWIEAAMFVNWLNTSTSNSPAYKFAGNGDLQLWEPGDAGYDPSNLFRNSLARYVLPDVDEWYKAAYYDPVADLYYNYPTASDTAPTPVASGTGSGTAVYEQSLATGPADVTLAGGLSPYGTMAQGGNVWELQETAHDLGNDSTLEARVVRGGRWSEDALELSAVQRRQLNPDPVEDFDKIGFRVVSLEVIPEPSSLGLSLLSTLLLVGKRRKR